MRTRAVAGGLVGLGLVLPGPALAQTAEDRLAVIDVTNALDAAVDEKDWDAARALFAETMTADLPGQGETRMASADLVGAWSRNLYADKASFHLRAGHVVAFNALPDGTLPDGDFYEVWGDYAHDLERRGEGWVITGFAFAPVREAGNTDLPAHRPD